MKAYMYAEGNSYYVVYGDPDSLLGPSEKQFSNKKEAETFMNKQNEKENA